jgi:hypothetical protein
MAKKNPNQSMANQSVMTRQNFKPRSPNQQRPSPFQSPYIQTVNPKSTIGKPNQSLFESELLFNVELDVMNLVKLNSIQVQFHDPPLFEKALYYDIKHLYADFLSRITPMIVSPVNAIVPKDTGRLRATILQSLQGNIYGSNGSYTRIGNLHPFTVVINTGKVKYAAIVNEMPNEWLKHFGFKHGTNTGKSNKKWKPKQKIPHNLHDPGAETDWFGKLVETGRKIWTDLWSKYLNNEFEKYFHNTIQRSNSGSHVQGQAVYNLQYFILSLFGAGGVP